ncbi:hypothetical protein SynPROS91_01135 [Synechococcus sp. PROS-9-1]|uniref:hypothetical protein n=1 Tax=Synechococcus sp. PROS-9-1 TaxID=1968775 RepID=UPI0016455BC3|nr:hypothetical protein [Synechococcus sp. PROS-9-1]QNJ31513.1 hypothetical protein SynPROS91_01135 [Synechococcus sp. PROS-9-1]
MTLSTIVSLDDELKPVQVDNSAIDVSEVEESKQAAVLSAATEYLRIETVADRTIERVVREVRRQEWIAKGAEIRKIRAEIGPDTKCLKLWHSLNMWDPAMEANGLKRVEGMSNYSNIMRMAVNEAYLMGMQLDDEFALRMPHQVIQLARTKLPEDLAEFVLCEAQDQDEPPTCKEIEELATQPTVKLSKAEEVLAKFAAKKEEASKEWEEVRGNASNPGYQRVRESLERAERLLKDQSTKVAELEAEIEKEKLNTAEEAEEKARVEKELQKLKFDDAAARAERVKRVSSTLTLSVPQTLADVQKFFAERNDYPEEVQKHLLQQCTLLANYIGDQL